MKKLLLIALLVVGCDTDITNSDENAVTTYMGNVYIQGCGVGCASYHFDDADNIYISYSNAPSSWKLDNGQAFPLVKKFTNIEFDDSNRTFYGTIDWSSPENSTVDNAKQWVYTMIFSNHYTTIESGTVKQYDANNILIDTWLFGSQLIYNLND